MFSLILFISLFSVTFVISSGVSSPAVSFAEAVVLDYNDLLNDKDLSEEIEKAFGNNGLGILTVKNIPGVDDKRQNLLPLARRFALLDDEIKEKYVHEPSYYSFGWSHGKEKLQGKPDISKGSYYANPIHDEVTDDESIIKRWPGFAHPNIWPKEDLPELESAFKDLGKLIIDVGKLVARQADRFVAYRRPHYPPHLLENMITQSKCAKARLLHYFPKDQTCSDSKGDCAAGNDDHSDGGGDGDDLFSNWCGWHNDHGSLTGLLPAMFMNQQTGEEVQNTDSAAGLYIRSRSSELFKVNIPAGQVAFQIGECAQIHSGGALQATPHAVRGSSVVGVSRETFAVFMEPQWDEPMFLAEGMSKAETQSQSAAAALPKGVPPLSKRWHENMNFGEFTESTLNEYY